MGNDAQSTETTRGVDFVAVQKSPRFRDLRHRHRSFVLPVTAGALLWYFAYVLLSGYAHDFMSTPVFGSVNVAILLGFAQVATTFIITMIYVSYANRRLDPLATELREELEPRISAPVNGGDR